MTTPPYLDMPQVLYEDAHLLVVNKPAGLVVHPAYKHPDNTLADAIFSRAFLRGEPRPWLLHRLDRETSGVVLFAKTETARRGLVRQFERRSIRKRYLAIVRGTLDPLSDMIDAPLKRDPHDRRRTIVDQEGQPAETWYQVLAESAAYALVLAQPRTGRTHQIRAHLAWRGAPLAGDICYHEGHTDNEHDIQNMRDPGDACDFPRVMLHAWHVFCIHPATGALLQISAPVPPDMRRCIDALKLIADYGNLPDVVRTVDTVDT